MESYYLVLFGLGALVATVLEYGNRVKGLPEGKRSSPASAEFFSFRMNYLVVYSMAMAGDWLQGPYVYRLYEHYGFDRGDIGRLFIAGFGSSMIFGTIVGGLADKHGRRRAALLYCASYAFGCVTKHFNSFWILFLGRVFCGIATSLLYSVFESWLVAEHTKRGFDTEWLGGIFSQSVFLGNGLMAIVSGLVGHALVETVSLPPVAPFDAAFIVLVVAAIIILMTWTENFGDAGSKAPAIEGFRRAAKLILSEPKIALLGAMQALFEGSMYTFVFLWTPALSSGGEHIPHGMIFACFMVASMAGSALAGKLLAQGHHHCKVEKYMQVVFVVSAACLFVPVLYHREEAAFGTGATNGLSWEGKIQLAAFCAFEACVGVFWPSMMTMRSTYVPEEMRATIINFFRIPLNLFVCMVLYNVSSFALSTMFGMCSFFLLVCFLCQRYFASILHQEQAGSHFDEDDSESGRLIDGAIANDGKKVELSSSPAPGGTDQTGVPRDLP